MTFEVARDQLKSIVERVERLELEIKDLNADKSDIYKEARANGFDVKAIKQVVSQRKLDTSEREEADLVFETYWNAVHGLGLVRAHARENIEEFDAETGEVFDTESPRKAAEAVSERTAFTDATIVSVLVEADKAEAVAGVLGQPETIPALTVQHDGVNVSDPERADVTDRRDDHLNSPIAPASQGEAEAPSVESVSPEIHGSSDANTGGEDVTPQNSSAPIQAGSGLVSTPRPAAKHPALLLRPHCQKPGAQDCPGSGRNHCRACAAAMREEEVA